ncbi:type I restriction enzyme S subunit [Salegentibacter sp. 24]|uniref:restriction endonuclease subunit S n=1 Tax=Salegentibacter sp. 24 TaxID=2183986 RepID=UPI00105CACAC|nr:restriction endonuclease subunit S [Salegentibacter sp. 24]TDN83510.1 type I restriction enzyme S subunit [Salegentibacter sp. 24]
MNEQMPENWKTYKLGEIATLRKQTVRPKDFNGEKYIGLEHIGQGDFLLNGIGISSDVTSNKFKFKSGDILYGKIRPYFKKVYKPTFSGICSTDILIIKSSSEDAVIQEYLYQLIKTQAFTDKAVETSSGTKMPRADWNSLEQAEFIFPPLSEQKSIASILSALDDKIELNLQMNKTLEEMAMALYKHWFVDFGPFQDGEFLDSELGKIPKGWEVKRLDEFALKKSESFNFKNKEDVVFVNTGDVQEGRFLHSNRLPKKGLPGQAKKAIEKGDILYSEIRPKNKRFAYVNFDSEDYVVSTKFMIINPKSNILSKLLYRILTMQSTVDNLNSIAEGRSGTFPQITFDAISDLKFILPPLDVQEQFQAIVGPMELKQDELYIENQTLTQLRDTLLPKLISGEVRVKDAKKTLSEVL